MTPNPGMPSRATSNADFDAIAVSLGYLYDGVFGQETVDRAVNEARDELESVSRIPTYLPLLTEKLAKERLLAAAQADGLIAKSVPEILSVCVHNAGRSQMAAALARHLSGGKVHVRSAGSAPTGEVLPLAIEVLAELGVEVDHAFPKALSGDVVRAADASL